MFSTSAPYVVTAMISLISWILSTYFAEVRSVPYIKYELVHKIDKSNETTVRYRFTNLSPSAHIDGLNVSLVCPNETACLGIKRGNSIVYARSFNVEPWSMKTAIELSASAASQDVSLPPDMSFEIECYLNSKTVKLSVLFTKNNSSTLNIKIVKFQGFDLFFARNYLIISFFFWLISMVIIVGAYTCRPAKVKEENTPTNVHLTILGKG